MMERDDLRIETGFLRLEASTACQLRCPTCPTGSGEIHKYLGRGFLRKDRFRAFLEHDRGMTKVIELSNYGEIFLNPHLLDIMKIAAEFGVALTVRNGANLNNVRDDVLEGLVQYGVRSIVCSIDGASQNTYELYRRNGDFDTVIANIRKINDFKKKHHSPYPKLAWQFVIFGHNEHEITKARLMAAELGMEFRPKLSWSDDISPVRNNEAVLRDSGLQATTREHFQEKSKTVYLSDMCDQLWEMPQVNYDGRVLGCCVNYWEDFGGNLFEDYDAALNGEKIRYARGMLTGRLPAREDNPCTRCDTYKARARLGAWVHPYSPRKRLKRAAKRLLAFVDRLRCRFALGA